jgi:hypothetical protein
VRCLLRFSLCGVAVALVAPGASAQIVRGTVTERSSGAPLSGVLITVERTTPSGAASPAAVVANALTNRQGEFALRLSAAGEYVLSAKRIGVERSTTPPFTIAAGENRRIDVFLDAVTQSLPTIAVVASPMCVRRPEQTSRLAALWDEVRTALLATQITLRDRTIDATVYRYVRWLEPEELRVVDETRTEITGRVSRPFASLSADSLSKVGYWHDSPGESVSYHAPDANVLLSDTFLSEHCFSLEDGNPGGRPMIGLAFEPAPSRRLPDIRGTLWVDASTYELRHVAYRYTRMRENADARGEVHFARLPDGTWIVRRWFLRMPQYARFTTFETAMAGRPDRGITTTKVHRFVEEGGDVYVPGVHFFERPAVVTGVAQDSSGAPLEGAVVRLAGSPHRRESDAQGSFRFDSLPAGSYTLVVEEAGYRALGMLAVDQSVSTAEGFTQEVELRAASTLDVMSRLCDRKPPAKGRSVLRLIVVDAGSQKPMPAAPIHLYWTARVDGRRPTGIQQATDRNGAVVFCDVPGDTELFIRLLSRDLKRGAIAATCRIGRGEAVRRTVALRNPAGVAAAQRPAAGNPNASSDAARLGEVGQKPVECEDR